MAYVDSVEIEGLAGKSEITRFKLNRDLNIFFGGNGSGKTSFLRIIESALSQDSSSILDVSFKTARVTIYTESYRTFLNYFISKEEKSNTEESDSIYKQLLKLKTAGINQHDAEYILRHTRPKFQNYQWELSSESKRIINDKKSQGWQHIYLPTWRMISPKESPRTSERNSWESMFTGLINERWNRYSGKQLRSLNTIQEEGLTDIFKAMIRAKDTGAAEKINDSQTDIMRAYERLKRFLERMNASDVLGDFEQFKRDFSQNTYLRNLVKEINKIEVKVEKISLTTKEMEKLISRMFSGNKQIQFAEGEIFATSDTGEDIPLRLLSSGEKQILYLFVRALEADISSFIIDEPEISLHIDWQKDLVRNIRLLNNETQLIMATHSPEIMADISDDKIFRL